MSDQEKQRKLDSMYEKAKGSFPGVREITAEELLEKLREGGVVLVDVRTPDEQAVSMIPGAITAQEFEQQSDRYRESTVVPYCTVGGRSGRYTQALAERGFDARNFRGAILAWTHAGGPLQDAEGPTRRVHVHGRKFDLAAEGYEAVW